MTWVLVGKPAGNDNEGCAHLLVRSQTDATFREEDDLEILTEEQEDEDDDYTDDQEQISNFPLHTILTSNMVNTADAGDNSVFSLITSSVMVHLDSHTNPDDDSDRFDDNEDNYDSFDIRNDIGTRFGRC